MQKWFSLNVIARHNQLSSATYTSLNWKRAGGSKKTVTRDISSITTLLN